MRGINEEVNVFLTALSVSVFTDKLAAAADDRFDKSDVDAHVQPFNRHDV